MFLGFSALEVDTTMVRLQPCSMPEAGLPGWGKACFCRKQTMGYLTPCTVPCTIQRLICVRGTVKRQEPFSAVNSHNPSAASLGPAAENRLQIPRFIPSRACRREYSDCQRCRNNHNRSLRQLCPCQASQSFHPGKPGRGPRSSGSASGDARAEPYRQSSM